MAGIPVETLGARQVGGEAGVEAVEAGERPAFAEDHGEARAKLPAFLKGDKLPEGYERVELGPQQEQLIPLGREAGSEVVVYAGNVGVGLRRAEDENVFFRFEGLKLPGSINPYKENPSFLHLENIGPEGIRLREGLEINLYRIIFGKQNRNKSIAADGFLERVAFSLPSEIQDEDGKETKISDLGWGVIFRVEGEGISVKNNSVVDFTLNLAVPPAAMVREGEVEAVEERAALAPAAGVKKGGDEAEAGRDSVQQRMAGAIKELVELGKNREVPDLGRRAGKAVAELLTAMGEAELELIEKLAGAALGKENLTDKDVTMFFGRVVGTAVRMKAEIISPTPHLEETELFISLKSLLVLSKQPDSPSRQEDAGHDLGRILTNLSRVDAGVRDRLVAAGLNKEPEELTEEDMLIFFGRVVGTAVAMKAKM